MIYLYGWNSISEFILDEYGELGVSVEGVVVDDAYKSSLNYAEHVNIIAASSISFTHSDKVINCLGYKDLAQRILIGERLLALGVLSSFISKKAKVHGSTSIAAGTILLGDVNIERRCEIGKHCIFWGGSRICHDSVIGSGVFLASGSIIGGACTVGNMCSLGFNSSTREKVTMPDGTKVGANRFWRG